MQYFWSSSPAVSHFQQNAMLARFWKTLKATQAILLETAGKDVENTKRRRAMISINDAPPSAKQ